MKKIYKTLPSILFATFFIALCASVSEVRAQSCESQDEAADTQIVETIYAKIEANSKLASQMSHINVVSCNSVVKLQGWVKSEDDFNKVYDYAFNTKGVKMVNSNGLAKEEPANAAPGGSCLPGTKPCSDICIPVDDVCNIKTGK